MPRPLETARPLQAAAMFDLTGRVALVTGASSGLGVRFARVLAANGAAVVLAARRVDRLEALADEIRAGGGKAATLALDVADRAAIPAAFDEAEQAFGPIDILLNNAGIAGEGRAVETPDAEFDRIMGVNVDAVFAMARECAARLMAKGQPGAIVNIASILSFTVSKGVAPYAVSKAAVMQLTKALAIEWAFRGIRVNAIAPGYFVTEINADYLTTGKGAEMTRQIPMGRFGEEGDLDGALLLLVSDAGRFMAGHTLVVDGGQVVTLRA